MSEPRELALAEVREQFMQHLRHLVSYWDRQDEAPRARLNGLAFSFLSLLDGTSGGMPAFEVIPTPHPDDKSYCRSIGDNWIPQAPEGIGEHGIHQGEMLHDRWEDA